MRWRLCAREALADFHGSLLRSLPVIAFLTLEMTSVGLLEGTAVNDALVLERQLLDRGSSTWTVSFADSDGQGVPPSKTCDRLAAAPGIVSTGGLATAGSRRLAASPATRFRRVVMAPGTLGFFGITQAVAEPGMFAAPSVAEELRIKDRVPIELLDERGRVESSVFRVVDSIPVRYPSLERALFEIGSVEAPEELVCLLEFEPWVDEDVARATASLLSQHPFTGELRRLLPVDELTRDPRLELRSRPSHRFVPAMMAIGVLGLTIALLARRRDWVVYRLCCFSHLETAAVIAIETWLMTAVATAWALWLCALILRGMHAQEAAIAHALWLAGASAVATLAAVTALASLVPPRDLLHSLKAEG